MVVHDHPAVAIEYPAARRDDGNRLDTVGLRAQVVHLRVLNLQPPKPGDQQQEDAHRAVLKDGDFPRREIRIVTQRRLVGKLLLIEVRIGWRQGHNFARRTALIHYSSRWVLMWRTHSCVQRPHSWGACSRPAENAFTRL